MVDQGDKIDHGDVSESIVSWLYQSQQVPFRC